MRVLFQLLIIFLSWLIRKRLLTAIGFNFAKNARIGLSVVDVVKVELGQGSCIGHLNYFRGIDLLSLAPSASIGNMNWVTGEMSVRSRRESAAQHSASLILEDGAAISNRHYIDCNAAITLGRFSTFAGVRSQIFTHSIDLNKNLQRVAPVVIGDYSFIGSGCIVLPDAVLPNRSVLSAGSVLRRGLSISSMSGIYTGNPAKFEKVISEGALYFSRLSPVVEMGH
jgi:hypothetical protein